MKGAVLLISLLAASVSAKHLFEEEYQEDDNSVRGGYDSYSEDPCMLKRCGVGLECDLDENRQPVCICAHQCAQERDPRAKVCSTQNVTFDSECEFHRQKCLCERRQPGCEVRKYRKAHLDYFGECREIAACQDWEMEEYPERMRQWLYLVMEELANRRDLTNGATKVAEEAKHQNKKWVLPVIWKFCELDVSQDRYIDSEELVPLTAPLKPLEHCTGPFLEKCDRDDNGKITLEEWGHCLGLDAEEVEDRCDSLRN